MACVASYDTDLTDEQWDIIGHLLTYPRYRFGRKRSVDVRRVFDAIMYVLKTGCHWRLLPHDFPHWRTCFGYFQDWRRSGKLSYIHKKLVLKTREAAGRGELPSTVIIDSTSVKTSKMSAIEDRGYDGNKKVKGRKRHIAADSLGLPLAVKITKANENDKKHARSLLERANNLVGGTGFDKVYADGGYVSDDLEKWCKDELQAKLVISPNLSSKEKGFVPVSQRWVVERTFSWTYDCRRLVVDHERTMVASRYMVLLAAIRLMLRKLCPS